MKKIAVITCAAAVFGLSGCSMFNGSESLVAPVVPEDAKMEDFSNIDESELKVVGKYADKYTELFVKAIIKEDYSIISPFLAPPLKKQMTETKFKAMSKHIKETGGKPGRTQKLDMLKQGLFSTSVYKVEFIKKSKKSTVVNDNLLRMSLGKLDDNYLIWNVLFD